MELDYRTKGTCASNIHVVLDGRKVKSVVFTGGCNGNLQGISRLVEGMDIDRCDRARARHSLRHEAHVLSRSARPRA